MMPVAMVASRDRNKQPTGTPAVIPPHPDKKTIYINDMETEQIYHKTSMDIAPALASLRRFRNQRMLHNQ